MICFITIFGSPYCVSFLLVLLLTGWKFIVKHYARFLNGGKKFSRHLYYLINFSGGKFFCILSLYYLASWHIGYTLDKAFDYEFPRSRTVALFFTAVVMILQYYLEFNNRNKIPKNFNFRVFMEA